MTHPPTVSPTAGRAKARRRRRQVPVLVVICLLVAAAAAVGGVLLGQLRSDDPLTASPGSALTTDPRTGLVVGHQVSSLNGLDVPLPDGFRLEYESFYPDLGGAVLVMHHEEIAHRAQIYTFLQEGAYPDAETACLDYQRDLASGLSGSVTIGEIQSLEASGELTTVSCSVAGQNQDLGEFHYEYRAYSFPDGRTILQQTRLPGGENPAGMHESYRQYFTCLISDHFVVGLAECA